MNGDLAHQKYLSRSR